MKSSLRCPFYIAVNFYAHWKRCLVQRHDSCALQHSHGNCRAHRHRMKDDARSNLALNSLHYFTAMDLDVVIGSSHPRFEGIRRKWHLSILRVAQVVVRLLDAGKFKVRSGVACVIRNVDVKDLIKGPAALELAG